VYTAMEFSRCTRTRVRPTRRTARRTVSQNSAARRSVEVDIVLGVTDHRTSSEEDIDGPASPWE
jgi:hypothetical protein